MTLPASPGLFRNSAPYAWRVKNIGAPPMAAAPAPIFSTLLRDRRLALRAAVRLSVWLMLC